MAPCIGVTKIRFVRYASALPRHTTGSSPRRTSDTRKSGHGIHLTERVRVTTPGNWDWDTSLNHSPVVETALPIPQKLCQRRIISCQRLYKLPLLVTLQRHNQDNKCSTAALPTDLASLQCECLSSDCLSFWLGRDVGTVFFISHLLHQRQ
ncbi:hypothetical protein EJ02DRAFT_47106 [Clathrospora elynae]|uniref:Uncharacterized protein n=1 Tax=Clathrospora elynae TaxID=706981 RepID=A0A6A5SDI1_9PLEO|nr:hypothetical protein EJ02DRAFT_47106 [Clathrospora elynae]